MKVKKKKPAKKLCEAWPATTMDRRLYDCVFMLALHGYVTHAEETKIKKRIGKFADSERW